MRLHIAKAKAEPPLDDAWQDVVEASFAPASEDAALTGWGGEAEPVALMLDNASYRVRLCAAGMDEARQQDTLLDGEEPIDNYSLVFWKAEPGPDRVVKQTSATAAYWHGWAQGCDGGIGTRKGRVSSYRATASVRVAGHAGVTSELGSSGWSPPAYGMVSGGRSRSGTRFVQ